MRNADNVYSVFPDKIKYYIGALRTAIITFFYVWPVPPHVRILSYQFKTLLNGSEIQYQLPSDVASCIKRCFSGI